MPNDQERAIATLAAMGRSRKDIAARVSLTVDEVNKIMRRKTFKGALKDTREVIPQKDDAPEDESSTDLTALPTTVDITELAKLWPPLTSDAFVTMWKIVRGEIEVQPGVRWKAIEYVLNRSEEVPREQKAGVDTMQSVLIVKEKDRILIERVIEERYVDVLGDARTGGDTSGSIDVETSAD